MLRLTRRCLVSTQDELCMRPNKRYLGVICLVSVAVAQTGYGRPPAVGVIRSQGEFANEVMESVQDAPCLRVENLLAWDGVTALACDSTR